MKITIDGIDCEFELVPLTSTDIYGLKVPKSNIKPYYGLKPVKKPKKQKYYLEFADSVLGTGLLLNQTLDLTPTAANKLSEAISALVEYVTAGNVRSYREAKTAAIEAAKSFQESQND